MCCPFDALHPDTLLRLFQPACIQLTEKTTAENKPNIQNKGSQSQRKQLKSLYQVLTTTQVSMEKGPARFLDLINK